MGDKQQMEDQEIQCHRKTISSLATQWHAPLEEVHVRYHQELDRLGRTARIRCFLPILIERIIREHLRTS